MIDAVLGIDPGSDKGAMGGGWCLITRDSTATAGPLPFEGRVVDVRGLFWPHTTMYGAGLLVVIEEQALRSGEGVRGGNTMMTNYGRMTGAIEMAAIPLLVVKPKVWKGDILAHTARDKPAAIQYTASRYPSIDLKPGRLRKPHEGIADAVCIAAHGWSTIIRQ